MIFVSVYHGGPYVFQARHRQPMFKIGLMSQILL